MEQKDIELIVLCELETLLAKGNDLVFKDLEDSCYTLYNQIDDIEGYTGIMGSGEISELWLNYALALYKQNKITTKQVRVVVDFYGYIRFY